MLLSSTSTMFLVAFVAATDGIESPIRVACIGDSITYGSGYTLILQDMLGEKYNVRNFGSEGSAVTLNSEKPYMSQIAYKKALDFNPQVVVIMLGTNDANDKNYQNIEEFSVDYERLITSFRKLSDEDKQIWLVQPPPILENDLSLSNSNLNEGVIAQIENVAIDLSLPTINVNSALTLTNSSEYFFDGVHPDQDGATVIANEIGSAIAPTNYDLDNDIG
jgi:acyl-CoA thioesterase-1